MRTFTAGTTVLLNRPRLLVRSSVLVYAVIFISIVVLGCLPAFASVFLRCISLPLSIPFRPGARTKTPDITEQKRREKEPTRPRNISPPPGPQLLEAKFLRFRWQDALASIRFRPPFFSFLFFQALFLSFIYFSLCDTSRSFLIKLACLGLPRRWGIEMGGGGLWAFVVDLFSLILFLLSFEMGRNNGNHSSFLWQKLS